MKDNNWAPLQPIAKKVLNKVVPNVNKRPQVKSKFADFLKSMFSIIKKKKKMYII